MRMQTRLNLAATVVIAVVAISIGSASVISHFNAAVGRIDHQLASAVKTVKETKSDYVSASLAYKNLGDIPVSVSLVPLGRILIPISGDPELVKNMPSDAQLKLGLKQAVTFSAPLPTRIRTLSLGDDEYVLFASSAKTATDTRARQTQLLIIAVLVSVSIGVLILSMFIHRDISKIERLIVSAEDIASGKKDVNLPTPKGNSEVDKLTAALDRMVTRLQQTVEMERNLQQTMQNFLGDASHELRTPLTVIKGYVEILTPGNENSPELAARAHDRVNAQIERMENLIRELLLLAELGERKTHENELINVSTIIEQSLEDLKVLQPQRPITSAITPNLIIEGATHLIDQLFANTFSNIRRHTPETAPLDVEVKMSDHFVEVTFQDGGEGLPAETYESGIAHFQRFDTSRSRDTGGSGLGMSIMAAIARGHGGEIELSQSKFGGLCTRILLPVHKPQNENELTA